MRENTENILGYAVENRKTTHCVQEIAEWVDNGKSCKWLACINPHSYVVALKEHRFSKSLREADWLIPDGIGIVFASKMLRGVLRQRITGSDIFYGLTDYCNTKKSGSVFFLGASEKTLAQIKAKMAKEYPNVTVAGTYSPPFKLSYTAEEIDDMVDAINESKANILWVGMTSPKQDLWIRANYKRLEHVKFAAGIGAVFDFYAGNVKRSPKIFRDLGLEWLIRLLQEPRRLAKRYLVNSPVFMANVFRSSLRRNLELAFPRQKVSVSR